MRYIRPLLGLLQGIIIYTLMKTTPFGISGNILAIITLTFPLVALQIKLPKPHQIPLGVSLLAILAIIYGVACFAITKQPTAVIPVLSAHIITSAIILFIFYCVVMEEGRFYFPYATLFTEAWQVILKIILGHILIGLVWGLSILAVGLFLLIGLQFIKDLVVSSGFFYIMPPVIFGVAMTILTEYEDVLVKLRNILLAFCRFLYPIFTVISIIFFVLMPLSKYNFDHIWPVIPSLALINILLFNGMYQSGLSKAPYSKWFNAVVYANLLITTGYSFFAIGYSMKQEIWSSLDSVDMLLVLIPLMIIALYHLGYSLAIFFSRKPWLSMIKPINTIMALLVAMTYIILPFLPF